MDIKKEGEYLIVKIPLKQKTYDYVGTAFGEIDNIVGVIESREVGFAKVIEMGYKDSFDYGDTIVKVDMSKDNFRELCKSLNIYCHEYVECSKCSETIYGSFGWEDGGAVCLRCNRN